MIFQDNIAAAAALLKAADGILICAGAGIGVDSGLPDFRGDEGFWKAYPPLAKAGIRFVEIANPAAFHADVEMVWGFYGHRLQLYRHTVPHEGFDILRRLASSKPAGSFIFTSNVDGPFQKAGFAVDRIVEYHGSIHHLQCANTPACTDQIWPADDFSPLVDEGQCRLVSPIPRCHKCGGVARPNILMFNDGDWIGKRTAQQEDAFASWLVMSKKLVVVEIGAGTNIPSVRRLGESLGAPLIRINPREASVLRPGDVSLSMGASKALRQIQAILLF
jgi:NAD-dependent SIR2 family protein deacetylase